MPYAQHPFFYPTNALHGATVTCSDATNPERLVSWLTDRPLLTSSVASTEIDVELAAPVTLAHLHLYNVAEHAGATFRARWSDENPFNPASVVYDSGVLPMVASYDEPEAFGAQHLPPQVYTTNQELQRHGYVPVGIPGVESIRLNLAAGGAVNFRIGYLWGSDAESFDAETQTGWDFAPKTEDSTRPMIGATGGVAAENVVSRHSFDLSVPRMTSEDGARLRGLFAQAGATNPFLFFRPIPPGGTRFSRWSEGGIVSFGGKFMTTPTFAHLQLTTEDKRHIPKPFPLYHWR
jgi:hypothetical protein